MRSDYIFRVSFEGSKSGWYMSGWRVELRKDNIVQWRLGSCRVIIEFTTLGMHANNTVSGIQFITTVALLTFYILSLSLGVDLMCRMYCDASPRLLLHLGVFSAFVAVAGICMLYLWKTSHLALIPARHNMCIA